MQIVAVIVLVRTGDQQMLAGDARRARAVRWSRRPRVPSGRLPKRDDERVAPDSALWRNEQAERRKPVLIDEMLEHHRRRLDGMIDIMDALVVGRIDAERMGSGPVLARRHDLALRPRGRQASLVGYDRQICRFVKSDRNSRAGRRQRVAPPAPEIPPRRAFRQAACSDRLRRTSFSFSILSHATAFRWLSNKSGSYSTTAVRGPSPAVSVAGLCPRTRPRRQERLIHCDQSRPRDFVHF